MEEVEELKSSENEHFSYEAINAGPQIDPASGYASDVSPDGFFIELKGKDVDTVRNPLNWKVHISLLENEKNIGKAWDAIVDILIRYKVQSVKVLRKSSAFQEYQKGKEITIYFQEGNIDWAGMFTEIEDVLLAKGAVPNYKAIGDKQIDGSQFLSCRQAEDVLAILSDTHNPSGIPHLFEFLHITSHFPKVVKILRNNEARVKSFYAQLEKNYFEILKEFRANFPYILGKSSIFSRINESRVEDNFQRYRDEVSQNLSQGIKEIILIGKEIEKMRQQKENLIETMEEEVYQVYLEKMLEKFERIRELVSHVLGILNENSSESDPSSGGIITKEMKHDNTQEAQEMTSPRFVIEYSSVEESTAHSEESSKAEESPRTSEDAVIETPLKSPRAGK